MTRLRSVMAGRREREARLRPCVWSRSGSVLSTRHSARVWDLEGAAGNCGHVCQDDVRCGCDGVCVAPAISMLHRQCSGYNDTKTSQVQQRPGHASCCGARYRWGLQEQRRRGTCGWRHSRGEIRHGRVGDVAPEGPVVLHGRVEVVRIAADEGEPDLRQGLSVRDGHRRARVRAPCNLRMAVDDRGSL